MKHLVGVDGRQYIFFYGGSFSNFSPHPFVWAGLQWPTSEHAFHWFKAHLFGDFPCAGAITRVDSPAEAKQLGQNVCYYDDDVWARVRYRIMVSILETKFREHPAILAELFATKTAAIVEASATDRVWGIGRGLEESHAILRDPKYWRGQNLLGKALMAVRDTIVAPLSGAKRERAR